jgi:hypothetical protein
VAVWSAGCRTISPAAQRNRVNFNTHRLDNNDKRARVHVENSTALDC